MEYLKANGSKGMSSLGVYIGMFAISYLHMQGLMRE